VALIHPAQLAGDTVTWIMSTTDLGSIVGDVFTPVPDVGGILQVIGIVRDVRAVAQIYVFKHWLYIPLSPAPTDFPDLDVRWFGTVAQLRAYQLGGDPDPDATPDYELQVYSSRTELSGVHTLTVTVAGLSYPVLPVELVSVATLRIFCRAVNALAQIRLVELTDDATYVGTVGNGWRWTITDAALGALLGPGESPTHLALFLAYPESDIRFAALTGNW
jgi:hypothetical protein